MKHTSDLQQIIYTLLAAQIEFGVYRFHQPLPTMEESSKWLSVSLDTVRSAYLRLEKEGYITLSKKVGSLAAVDYDSSQIEQHIQDFFSQRKSAVLDLCRSLDPLFSHAQWFALKNASQKQLDEMELLCSKKTDLPLPYTMIRHLQLIYSTLNNDLLLRLVWQAFMFFQAPFLSLPQNKQALGNENEPLLHMIGLCRKKDWDGLWHTVSGYQSLLTNSIIQFYEKQITSDPPRQKIDFHWNAYQKPSQRCYSLAMELLIRISRGAFAEDDFLPSPAKIAEYNQLSLSTVRRTLALLNQLGAVRSVNGVGTQVLSTKDSAAHCNFSHPAIQKRLLDFVQSLHILTLTCKSCAKVTFEAMDTSSIRQFKEQLLDLKNIQRHETVVCIPLKIIADFAPIKALRTIYEQLLRIFLWGYPLRSLHGAREAINKFYLPYIDEMTAYLDNRDWIGLSTMLEALLQHEFKFAKSSLNQLGIREASKLTIPES